MIRLVRSVALALALLAVTRAVAASPPVTPSAGAVPVAAPPIATPRPAASSPAASPTAEFETPYVVRILPGGTVVEISGSFSWALPQNFVAMLAQAPQVRTIRLESLGGHLKPAMEVGEVIRARGLDTYVGRICASACTLAYLGGAHRFLAPGARLGFHQASAPGVAPAQLDPVLRLAYTRAGLPPAFVAHVLRTPPQSVWFPSQDELRTAGFMTGAPPAEVTLADGAASPAWREAMKLLPVASDAALVQFATSLSALLAQLQGAGPEVCWSFAHQGPTDLRAYLKPDTLDAVGAAAARVREEATRAPVAALDTGDRARVLAALVGSMRAEGKAPALAALRPGADHAAFCPSLRALLEAALALPEAQRGQAVRALLSGG